MITKLQIYGCMVKINLLETMMLEMKNCPATLGGTKCQKHMLQFSTPLNYTHCFQGFLTYGFMWKVPSKKCNYQDIKCR